MTATDYNSKVFSGWRAADAKVWQDYINHPFVKGLGDGTLPRASYVHYLIQDYVFLIHFSRAWALAAVKSSTLSEMKTASATLNALVNHEMQLHVETCAREGISEETLFAATEEPENMVYTRFVMDIGLRGDFLDLMAALAPCVFGYGEIGLNLGPEVKQENPYHDWIMTYFDAEYQDVCTNIATMIETATRARLGDDFTSNPRWTGLCNIFSTATRLEVDFWQMALRGQEPA